MAFPVTLNGRTYTLADFSGTNYVDGFPDALEDFVTQAGNIYTTTSTSSVVIGTGSKTFTVADSAKPYTVGTPLRIADAAAPATNWIDGIVTSYSGTTLVVNAVAYAGSGTISSWNINIGGSAVAYTGTLPVAQGGTGGTTEAAARTNLDVYSKSEADAKFLDVSGEASNVTMTGDVTIGDTSGDTLTVNATATLADATITTADINGGTIDGTVIGGASAAAATFTDVTASGTINLSGATVSDGGSVTTVDINGGTIDGTVIGGSTPAAISGTTITATGQLQLGGGSLGGFGAESTSGLFYSGGASDGFVVINGNGANAPLYLAHTANVTSPVLINFADNGTGVGSISTNGTSTSYNTSSDYRRKEDVQPIVGATDRLMALTPVNFAWKANGRRVDGFLAHEVQEVVPDAVTGEKDAVDDKGNPIYQGIDQSKIVPLLTAALQEALTKIEALEARLAALEGASA